jgi:OPT oligopeptide transporter protein
MCSPKKQKHRNYDDVLLVSKIQTGGCVLSYKLWTHKDRCGKEFWKAKRLKSLKGLLMSFSSILPWCIATLSTDVDQILSACCDPAHPMDSFFKRCIEEVLLILSLLARQLRTASHQNSEQTPLLQPQSDGPAHEQPAAESRTPHHPFTRRVLCLSLFLGVAGSAMNTFFGLRTGSITGYSIPFAFIAKSVCTSLTNAESAVVVTVAVTMATMPMVVASLGVIPALQFLTAPREGGPVVLTAFRHLAWAQGIAYFPLFFAMPLRDQFLNQDDLPFPSATATAMTIDEKATRAALSKSCALSNDGFDTGSEAYPNRSEQVLDTQARPGNVEASQVMTFFIPVALSGVYVRLPLSPEATKP